MSERQNSLLIIGAGPFGLSMAAHARCLGIDYALVGQPMSFWKRHMPPGMLLRSGCDWHLDPAGENTIRRFLETCGQSPATVEPLSLPLYLQYVDWFTSASQIASRRARVIRLDKTNSCFEASLESGAKVQAQNVLLALGFAPFAYIPDELVSIVPPDRGFHASEFAEPGEFKGKRVLIVGGRQSAFEFAALLAEAGADTVHICHRHETPDFAESDWSWVDSLLERFVTEPSWYRKLPTEDRQALADRFWAEGRLKLEPWLSPRVHRPEICIRPGQKIVHCVEQGDSLQIQTSTGETLDVDKVMFATGYRPDIRRVSFLRSGNCIGSIECRDGSPVLDDNLQTTVPGLFITSLLAAQDFGPFFAFTAAARASAQMVGRGLRTN